jgi:sigma-E factor negative regulatory protein RseA
MVSVEMTIIENSALYRRIQLSALADGELHGEEFAEALAWFDGDTLKAEQTRTAWHNLHVVGDVLRSNELAACTGDKAFFTRLQSTLKREMSLEPAAIPNLGRIAPGESANEPVFRWKWVAGFTSVAAALAVSWSLVGGHATSSGAQLAEYVLPAADLTLQVSAKAPDTLQFVAVAADGVNGAVMLRNPQLDAMIAAHSQIGGSALQMPSVFLRNANLDAAPHRPINGSAR